VTCSTTAAITPSSRIDQRSSAATASISISASGTARFEICTRVLAGGLACRELAHKRLTRAWAGEEDALDDPKMGIAGTTHM
jgi:hypothetical protein